MQWRWPNEIPNGKHYSLKPKLLLLPIPTVQPIAFVNQCTQEQQVCLSDLIRCSCKMSNKAALFSEVILKRGQVRLETKFTSVTFCIWSQALIADQVTDSWGKPHWHWRRETLSVGLLASHKEAGLQGKPKKHKKLGMEWRIRCGERSNRLKEECRWCTFIARSSLICVLEDRDMDQVQEREWDSVCAATTNLPTSFQAPGWAYLLQWVFMGPPARGSPFQHPRQQVCQGSCFVTAIRQPPQGQH